MLAYSHDKMIDHEFKAFGVEDYLSDYYHLGKTMQELKDNISESGESVNGFCLTFPFEVDEKQLSESVNLIRVEGFYC